MDQYNDILELVEEIFSGIENLIVSSEIIPYYKFAHMWKNS